MSKLVLLLTVLAPAATFAAFPFISLPRPARTIATVGGTGACDAPAKRGSLAEFVRRHTLQILADGQPHCSGTAIEVDIVMTAKHCVPAGDNETKYSVRAFVDGSFREIAVDGVSRSLLQARDDMALVRLAEKLPAAAVPPRLKRGKKCDKGELVQAGFGMDDSGFAPKCARFLEYRSTPPKESYGFGTSGGLHYLFYAEPKLPNPERPASGCNGDSGGPMYCRSGGKWVYAGLMVSTVPHYVKNAKGEDVPEPLYAGYAKVCEDRKQPESVWRPACVNLCRRARAVAGYWINEAEDGIRSMRALFGTPADR